MSRITKVAVATNDGLPVIIEGKDLVVDGGSSLDISEHSTGEFVAVFVEGGWKHARVLERVEDAEETAVPAAA